MSRIFISYKRKDLKLVKRYVGEIESKIGETCWMDLAQIETSEQFASVICSAIDHADVFLFMHSASHLGIDFQTDWTLRELNYAIAKHKRVVLIKMDETPLDNLFLMLFAGTNNIQITDPIQKQKLFADLKTWLNPDAPTPKQAPTLLPRRKKFPILALAGGLLGVGAVICALLFLFRGGDSPGKMITGKEVVVSDGIGSVNGFAYVDLGLSVMWARCNVGASNPWEFGDFFAWGETTSKAEYYPYTLNYYVKLPNNEFHLAKYNTQEAFGPMDGKTTLDALDDAASANMQGSWRMPTKQEVEELMNECRWERAKFHGVLGEKITGRNGNSIFIPYAGFHYQSDYREEGLSAVFWSSSINESHPERAYYIYSGHSGEEDVRDIYEAERYFGTTIRAVTE